MGIGYDATHQIPGSSKWPSEAVDRLGSMLASVGRAATLLKLPLPIISVSRIRK